MAKAGDLQIGHKGESDDDRALRRDEIDELIGEMAQMVIDQKVNVEK